MSEKYGVAQAAKGSARSEPVVSVRGLVKRYGSHEAVAGIDLEVRRGEIFAFLGPNGAGKTTTVEILEGFRQRTEGQVCVLGHDPATADPTWRDQVGVVLQESEPDPGLTVRECLAMYAGFYRTPRDIDQTIALAGLTEKAGAVGTRLSGGQRRRLDFALGLIGDPELIFLDEPTTGFDPSARRAAWEVIAGLRQLGKTVFLTTHHLDEAEYLADRITVLSAGHIVAEGTPATLGGREHMTTAISFTLPGHLHAHDLPPGLSRLTEPGPRGSTVLHSNSPLAHLQTLSNWALGRAIDLPDLDVHRPTLEEVYLSLTEPASKEIQTQAGRCSTHGTVEATREIPGMGFPFVVYGIWRTVAQRRPFLCPECGAAVRAD
jgi:ABC-2 type transport system ATP-binding protein